MGEEDVQKAIDDLNAKVGDLSGKRRWSAITTAIVSAAATVSVAFITNTAEVIVALRENATQRTEIFAERESAREQARLERDLDLQTTLILDALQSEDLEDQVDSLRFYVKAGLLGVERVAVDPEGLSEALDEVEESIDRAMAAGWAGQLGLSAGIIGVDELNEAADAMRDPDFALPTLGRVNDAASIREFLGPQEQVEQFDESLERLEPPEQWDELLPGLPLPDSP